MFCSCTSLADLTGTHQLATGWTLRTATSVKLRLTHGAQSLARPGPGSFLSSRHQFSILVQSLVLDACNYWHYSPLQIQDSCITMHTDFFAIFADDLAAQCLCCRACCDGYFLSRKSKGPSPEIAPQTMRFNKLLMRVAGVCNTLCNNQASMLRGWASGATGPPVDFHNAGTCPWSVQSA